VNQRREQPSRLEASVLELILLPLEEEWLPSCQTDRADIAGELGVVLSLARGFDYGDAT